MRLTPGFQEDEMTVEHRISPGSMREPFMHSRQYNCLSCSAEASLFVLSLHRDSPAQETSRSMNTKHPRGQGKRPTSHTCHWLARSGKFRAHHGLHKKRAYPSYEPARISSQHATRQTCPLVDLPLLTRAPGMVGWSVIAASSQLLLTS